MINLHIRYLLNKFNLITIMLVSGLYLIGLLMNVFSIPSNLDVNSSRDMYFYNVFTILKLIALLLIIFLMSISATSNNDHYQLFLIDRRKLRVKYYLTKVITLIIISFIIVSLFMIMYILVGLLFSSWYIVRLKDILFFINLWLLSFMYGMLSYILVKIFNTILIGFIPCLIVIIEEAFSNNELIEFMTYLFPVLEYQEEINLSYGVIHVVVLIISYVLLGLIKSYTIDIK